MLELSRVDLSALSQALEDHSDMTEWFLDPQTGEVIAFGSSIEREDEDEIEERNLMSVAPLSSHEGYHDMEDFIARVRDPRARDLLERAIAGRGAFRRFKDNLLEFPDLREAWFRFHDARTQVRAIEWLRDQGVIAEAEAEQALAQRSEDRDMLGEVLGKPVPAPLDPMLIAGAAAERLRDLYADRLRDVYLFGSWARGDAHPESDVDLLVVLDRVYSPWDEQRLMEDVLDELSDRFETMVTAMATSERSFAEPRRPALIRAKAEGVRVA